MTRCTRPAAACPGEKIEWNSLTADCVGPVNLGNPSEFSMLELAERVIGRTGSRSQIVFKPLPQDDPLQRRPDISLAKKRLQWEPATELEEGLEKTIAYFKEILTER
jgi:UDP-glucuronate decarboxylase